MFEHPAAAAVAGLSVAAAAAVVLVPALVAAETAPSDVVVRLETNQRIYYSGDPIDVRLTIFNRGDTAVAGPGEQPLLQGLELRDASGALVERGPTSPPGMKPPAELAPGHFFGVAAELGRYYPALADGGAYRVSWSSGAEMRSGAVGFRVIPRFDPDRDYEAVLELDRGEVVLELLGDSAPRTVKMFVDLARQGYYDGVAFTRVLPERALFAARPSAEDAPVQYAEPPRETGGPRHLAGSVGMYRSVATPGAVGADFYVALSPLPEQDARATVFAQVVDGMERVRQVALEMTAAGTEAEPVEIRSIRIRERAQQ